MCNGLFAWCSCLLRACLLGWLVCYEPVCSVVLFAMGLDGVAVDWTYAYCNLLHMLVWSKVSVSVMLLFMMSADVVSKYEQGHLMMALFVGVEQ